jgi:exopolyphosphatase/guanosine-5'-triphosphate,3'-diphosphate pyrophosphatase
VIDVGTNSVKLLVGDVCSQGTVTPVWETAKQTRLGAGFHPSGRLTDEAIRRTADCVGLWAEQARAWGVVGVGVIATSAVREATNQVEFVEAVREGAGLGVRVLTGEEESRWMYHGVASDPFLAGSPLLVADVGGGSTEVVLAENNRPCFHGSFRLGTVDLLERLVPGDPPVFADWRRCRHWIRRVLVGDLGPGLLPKLAALPEQSWRMVGASGTATILARLATGIDEYDRGRLEGKVLSRKELRQLRLDLWALPLAERRRMSGMPSDRADVMLMGVAIFEELMAVCGAEALTVSLRGLRYGAMVMLEWGQDAVGPDPAGPASCVGSASGVRLSG